jgi:hypothetical protein
MMKNQTTNATFTNMIQRWESLLVQRKLRVELHTKGYVILSSRRAVSLGVLKLLYAVMLSATFSFHTFYSSLLSSFHFMEIACLVWVVDYRVLLEQPLPHRAALHRPALPCASTWCRPLSHACPDSTWHSPGRARRATPWTYHAALRHPHKSG